MTGNPSPSSYAARMTRLHDHDGGALTKVLATLLVLALLASAALFVYTRSQDPLALGVDAFVGYNAALADHGTPTDPLVTLEPNGQIYVATTVRNDGTLPVTITGLGQSPNDDQTPYIPVELHLGDGKTANPAGSTSGFQPAKLNPGTGIGIREASVASSRRQGATAGGPPVSRATSTAGTVVPGPASLSANAHHQRAASGPA